MAKKNPYQIIKHQHVTEKASMLQELKSAKSNPSVRRCLTPKYVFIVDRNAKKHQIAQAFEEIYREKNVKVVAVNTINVKAKTSSRTWSLWCQTQFKKAIVTLEKDDSLDNI